MICDVFQFHSVNTLAKANFKCPVFVTEHGAHTQIGGSLKVSTTTKTILKSFLFKKAPFLLRNLIPNF
jgi:hypothetical protein